MFVVAYMLLMSAYILSCVWRFLMPRTVVHQAPLSMEFCRQEHWSGLPFPPPGDLPDPGIGCSLKNWALFHVWCWLSEVQMISPLEWNVARSVCDFISSLGLYFVLLYFLFLPVSLSYNRHIVLYKFKVHRLTIWFTNIMKWLLL